MDRERRSYWLWALFQFSVSVIVGCWTYVWVMHETHDARAATLGGFLLGLAATRAVMFLIAACRFGWRPARGMRMH